MRNEILPTIMRIINQQTFPDNNTAIDAALDLILSIVSDYTVEIFTSNNVKSLLIHNRKKGTRSFELILNGHIDIIPGKVNQYEARIEGDRLYGAGAMDMKASLVCLIYSFIDYANKVDYPLALQIVTDEQSGGFNGTKYQIDQGVRGDFIIAGEPTNMNIVNMAKGVLWLKLIAKGCTAHSAYPWNGENAILIIIDFLNKLENRYPIPRYKQWATTFNVSRIITNNTTYNKIPDDCEAWIDIRFTPKDNDIIDYIQAIKPKNMLIEIIENESAMFVDENQYYLNKLKIVGQQVLKREIQLYGAQGTSDARFYNAIGCVGVEFGPYGEGIGSDNEWVSIYSLEKYIRILKNLITTW